MDLFDYDPSFNLLPFDGELNYFGCVLSDSEIDYFSNQLLNTIEWKYDNALIHGKHITTKRKVAWYGDSDYAYTYSNNTKHALSWTKDLLDLKSIVENRTNTVYNSCLLNLYHNGEESMGWHSDDEAELGKNTSIASLSFGAERKFSLKHKSTKKNISLTLETGSLLVMKGETQSHWVHCLPKMRNINSPRVNLTFRTYK